MDLNTLDKNFTDERNMQQIDVQGHEQICGWRISSALFCSCSMSRSNSVIGNTKILFWPNSVAEQLIVYMYISLIINKLIQQFVCLYV